MSMNRLRILATAALAAASGLPAQAAEGLSVTPESTWPTWQARLSIGTSPGAALPAGADAANRLVAASMLGDYYFEPLRLGWAGGRFRATGGLLLGSANHGLGAASTPLRQGPLWLTRWSLPGLGLPTDPAEASQALPYMGVGYSSFGGDAGFSFSADVGVAAQSPGNASRVGRVLLGQPRNLDEAIRELRLMPVVQLGVRYTF